MLKNVLEPMSLPSWVLHEISKAPWEECYSAGNEHLVFSDIGMPISKNRSTLAPIPIAKVLASLEPKCNDNVLEVGSSVMRLTTIFSQMCCVVFTVENDEERYKADYDLCKKLQLRNVKCLLGDYSAMPENQSYSLIMINSAVRFVPDQLFDALLDGGRLCAVLGNKSPQSLVVFTKNNSEISRHDVAEVNLTMLDQFKIDSFDF